MTFAPSAATVTPALSSAKTSTTGQLKQIARSYTQPQSTRTMASAGYGYGTYGGAGTGAGYGGYGAYTRSSTNSATYGNYTSTTAVYSPAISTAAVGMERPLPPRSGGYSHRPRSMDLVTPFSAAGY
jgi:hypothetical protein